MEWVIWGFVALAAVVAVIIVVAAVLVLHRDRNRPNEGVAKQKRGPVNKWGPNSGVPKSR